MERAEIRGFCFLGGKRKAMTVNSQLVWGVNGETGTNWWRGGLSAAVSLSDKYGIKVFLTSNPSKHYLQDVSDGKSHKYSRRYAYRVYDRAIHSLGGITNGEMATTIKALNAALSDNSLGYNLTKIIALLKRKGLTLKQIKGLKGLTGKALIAELLTILGENPVEYTVAFGTTAKELTSAIKAYKDAPNATNATNATNAKGVKDKLDLLKQLLGNSTQNLAKPFITAGTQTLQIEANRLGKIERTAEAARKTAIEKRTGFIKYISTSTLPLQTLLEKISAAEHPDVKRAIGQNALKYITNNPTGVKATDVKKLETYIFPHLKQDQRIITFKYNSKTYVAVTEKKNDKWVFISKGIPNNYRPIGETKVLIKRSAWGSDLLARDHQVTARGVMDGRRPPEFTVRVNGMHGQHDLKIVVRDTNGNGRADAGEKIFVRLPNGELREIKGRLREIIDQYMKTRGQGDKVITRAELRYFLRVVRKYAKFAGLSLAEAVSDYLKEDQTFEDRNIDQGIQARAQILSSVRTAMTKRRITTLTPANLKQVLTQLGYHADIIAEVVRLANANSQLTVKFLINCLVRIVISASLQRAYRGVRYINREYIGDFAPQRMIGFLQGKTQPVVSGTGRDVNPVDDKTIISQLDAGENGVFGSSTLERGQSGVLQTAQQFISTLASKGKLAEARMAMQLIQKRAQDELRKLPKNERAQSAYYMIRDFTDDPTAHSVLAENYLEPKAGTKANLERAFYHASKVTAQRRTELFRKIFSSLVGKPETLILAYRVAMAIRDKSQKKQLLKQLSDACLRVIDGMPDAKVKEIRRYALKALQVIADIEPGYKTEIKDEYGRPKPVLIGEYIRRTKIKLETNLIVLRAERMVFPKGGDGSGNVGSEAKIAIGLLKTLIQKQETSARDQADAFNLLARIHYAKAMDAFATDPRYKTDTKYYEQLKLAAQATRQAALAYKDLKAKHANDSGLKKRYKTAYLQANSLIAKLIYSKRLLWFHKSEGGATDGRPIKNVSIKKFFRDKFAQYILRDSVVTYLRRGEQKPVKEKSEFFKSKYAVLDKDQEFSRTDARYLYSLKLPATSRPGAVKGKVVKKLKRTQVRRTRRRAVRRAGKTAVTKRAKAIVTKQAAESAIASARKILRKAEFLTRPTKKHAAWRKTYTKAEAFLPQAKTHFNAGKYKLAKEFADDAKKLALPISSK